MQKTSNTTVLRKQHERPIAEIKEVKNLERERERERESCIVGYEGERERERKCVCVCVSVCCGI